MPARFQRSRKAGYRLPPEVVYVGRPTIWGNPYPPGTFAFCVPDEIIDVAGLAIGSDQPVTTAESVAIYAAYVKLHKRSLHLDTLRGRDLCCWCRSGDPCHADVLLTIANAPKDLTLVITVADMVSAMRFAAGPTYSPIYYAALRAGYTGIEVNARQMICDQGLYWLDSLGRKIQEAHGWSIALTDADYAITLTDIGYAHGD